MSTIDIGQTPLSIIGRDGRDLWEDVESISFENHFDKVEDPSSGMFQLLGPYARTYTITLKDGRTFSQTVPITPKGARVEIEA